MNKQKRTFVILAIVLAACLAGYLGLLNYNKYKSDDDSESESDSVEALSLDSSDVKSLSFLIDGQEYTLSGDFSDSMIPAGFTAGEITYNDSTYKGAVQEKTGLQMAYLVDGDGKGDFWMYDSSDSSFSPAEQVVISDTYSIVIFDAGSKVSMPSKYSKGNLEINGKTFEIWDEPDRDGFYVLYAVNNDGEESLYLYDSVEHTYQRMETPKSATTPDKKSASKFDAILEKISDHLIWFVAAAAVIVILLVIFLLVSVVKLHNRNRELDDLYDEYELDDEPQRNPVKPIQPVKAEKKSQFKKRQDDDFEDDYDDFDDDFDDDDYYDDDFDDDYDDEGISDDTRSVDEFDDYFDDDDFDSFDDYNIKKEKRKKGDTFEMDFIDLD